MSNRRRRLNPRPGRDVNALNRWAASIDGARIPGGCDDCHAYQTVHPVETGVTRIAIHHDEWCPTYQRMQDSRGRTTR